MYMRLHLLIFFDGTMLIGEYIDSIISDLAWYKELLLEDVPISGEFTDDIGINSYDNTFDDSFMGGEHVFNKLKKIGEDIENICEYFNKKKINISKKKIRVFSVPNDGMCEISYLVKISNNGTTYVFSDMYFSFLNKRDYEIEKFNQ